MHLKISSAKCHPFYSWHIRGARSRSSLFITVSSHEWHGISYHRKLHCYSSIKCISKKISKIRVSCRLRGKITRYRWFSHKRTNVLVMTSSCRTDIQEPLVNSLRPNDAYTVSELGRHLGHIMACRLFGAASNHFLLQCWIIVNCSLRKSFNQNWIKILQFV